MITGNAVYFDSLTFAAMARFLAAGIMFRIFNPRKRLAVYYLTSSRRAETWAGFLRKYLRVSCGELDYANTELQDTTGESLYIKIVESDTLKVINRIILGELESHPLVRKISHKFEKDRLLAYLGKQLAPEIIPPLVKINVADWHHRTHLDQPAGEPSLYVASSDWSSYLKAYAQEHGVRLRFFRTPAFRGRVTWKRVRTAVLRLGKALFARQRRIVSPVAKQGEPQNERLDVVAAEFSGNGVSLDASQNSDLFWLPFCDVPPGQVLVYCTRPDDPLDEDKIKTLDEARFRYVAMNRAAAASERAPVWLLSSKFLKHAARMVRWVLWQSLQTGWRHPRRLSWLMPKMLFLALDYAYWRTFFETYRVKVLFNSQGSPQRRISAEQALADLGGISTSYQRSHLTTPNPWAGYSVDVHFAFSPMVSKLVRQSGGCASQVVATGYVCDRGFAGAAPRADRLRAALNEQGARFIICFLDEGSNSDKKDGYRADTYAAEDYDYLLTKLLEDPNLGLILKPKKPATLRQRLGPVSAALDAALATGRCFIYETGTVITTTLPCEAGMAADVTIGLLVGETASLECRLAGTPSLVLDREHIPELG